MGMIVPEAVSNIELTGHDLIGSMVKSEWIEVMEKAESGGLQEWRRIYSEYYASGFSAGYGIGENNNLHYDRVISRLNSFRWEQKRSKFIVKKIESDDIYPQHQLCYNYMKGHRDVGTLCVLSDIPDHKQMISALLRCEAFGLIKTLSKEYTRYIRWS